MDGRRVLAAAAAAGLLISLLAPWFRESIVARGLTGLRTMSLTRSGWDAFSLSEALVLVVAVVTLALVAAVPVGARDDDHGRLRLSGAIVTALGAIAFIVVLVRLASAPGTTRHALDATMVAVRWGIFLALGCSAALTVSGLRLIRVPGPDSAGAPRTRRGADSPRPARRGRAAGSDRASRPGRTNRAARPVGSERAPRAAGQLRSDRVPPRPDRVRPSGARADVRAPSLPPAARRTERPRPTRHDDRPRWEDQATGWLDLPDSLGD
jgi:hypothetical protein